MQLNCKLCCNYVICKLHVWWMWASVILNLVFKFVSVYNINLYKLNKKYSQNNKTQSRRFCNIFFESCHRKIHTSSCVLHYFVGPVHWKELSNLCHLIVYWKQKRSTEGCSKFKSPETRQVQERLVSTLEHMQVPKWDRTRCPEE